MVILERRPIPLKSSKFEYPFNFVCVYYTLCARSSARNMSQNAELIFGQKIFLEMNPPVSNARSTALAICVQESLA